MNSEANTNANVDNASPTGANPEAMKTELSGLVKDLSFPSETDAPIETAALSADSAADLEAKIKADAASTGTGDVGGAAESSAPAKIALSEVAFDGFMDMYGTVKEWQNDIQKDFARKFGDALTLLQKNSRQVKIFRLGGTRATLYILGQVSDTEWTGMKTEIVET